MSSDSSANVARFLVRQAEAQPDAIAVMAPQGRDADGRIKYEEITFAELHAQSDQVAHGFVKKGIRRGMRTLLMVRPGSDLIRCCFALFKMGAVPVVIDPGMGMKNFLSCVRRTRPEALVGIPLAQNVRRFSRRAFKSVRHAVTISKGFSGWYSKFKGSDFSITEPGPDELAAILFTSGSTGAPKGVCYGHGQFDAQVRLVRDTFSIEPGEVDLPMLPIFALFNPALGMTTVVPEMDPGKPAEVDPDKIIQAIEQCNVTNSFGSPVLWKKISARAKETGKTLPGLRRILMAGAPVPPVLVEQLQPVFPNATLWSPYGATECLPVSCIDGDTILEESLEKTTSGAGTCVGVPVAGVEIRIIPIHFSMIRFLKDTTELPAGEIGEIIATGPSVTKSYDGLKYATRRAKICDGQGRIWHRMGDAGYLDEDGRLWFCGRIAERVMTVDGPMYTDCCEGIFNAMKGVSRSALIGLGKAPDQEPAIVIEREQGDQPDEDDVLEFAAVFRPTRAIGKVFFSDAFPVDVRHNAKIHRLTLADQFKGK
ncbi:MAG: fatty acid CoA ligase family protein [Puniceicoccaceae bacterium]